MKIFMVVRGCPSKSDPQWGCFELDQARALRKFSHEVVMLYVDGRFRLRWRKMGVSCCTLEGIDYVGCFYYPGKLLSWLPIRLKERLKGWQLKKTYKEAVSRYGTPDVIYAHYMYNIARAVRLKEEYGIPLVGIEHWSELAKESLTSEERYLGETAYNGVDKLIAVSDALRQHIKMHFGKEATVVNNMVGDEFFQKAVVAQRQADVVRLVSIGSLIPRKGFDLLIRALQPLADCGREWQLDIIGAGPERAALQRMSEEAGLGQRICLLGLKNKDEIIGILQQSDAFVLASRAETFGVVYIEAMSQGLPVVATVCGGPEEFVTEKNGLLVPVDDVAVLTEALRDMICHVDRYDRQAIAEECRLRFSPEVIGKRLSELLGESV